MGSWLGEDDYEGEGAAENEGGWVDGEGLCNHCAFLFCVVVVVVWLTGVDGIFGLEIGLKWLRGWP